jgi:hypothetical protein
LTNDQDRQDPDITSTASPNAVAVEAFFRSWSESRSMVAVQRHTRKAAIHDAHHASRRSETGRPE